MPCTVRRPLTLGWLCSRIRGGMMNLLDRSVEFPKKARSVWGICGELGLIDQCFTLQAPDSTSASSRRETWTNNSLANLRPVRIQSDVIHHQQEKDTVGLVAFQAQATQGPVFPVHCHCNRRFRFSISVPCLLSDLAL